MEKEIISKLITLEPASIFVYGSRARTDFLDNSDWEIGVIFTKEKYVGRSGIKKIVDIAGVNIYPFVFEDISRGVIDTPFQKRIYLRELVQSGKTIYGKDIVGKLELTNICVIDLMQDLRFNLGYALAAVISSRNGDRKTAAVEFYKSCLFATRSLVVLKEKKFPVTYDEIVELSKKIELGEYSQLVKTAHSLRINQGDYNDEDLFKNISYLNKFIEQKLTAHYEEHGNSKLV
jgi:predicted nucleotidyltransferase